MLRKSAGTATKSRGASKTRTKTSSSSSSAGRGAPQSQTRGISRIDQAATRTHGFVVRVDYQRTDSGWRPKHTAFFGDSSHGGGPKALKAAEAWLKEVRGTRAAKTANGGASRARTSSAKSGAKSARSR
jgi:hypothetical protein